MGPPVEESPEGGGPPATEADAVELQQVAAKRLDAGDEDGAISAALRALDMFEEVFVNADTREAACYRTLAMAHLEVKDTQKALKAAKECVERFEDSGNKQGHGDALQLLSLVQDRQGYVGKAVRSSTRAAYAFEDAGYQRGQAKALATAGKMLSRLGLYNKALRNLQEALDAFEELNDIGEQANILRDRAEVYMGKKDTKSAVRCANESRELFQDAKDTKGEAFALLQLCAAQLADDDLERAARTAEEAQGLASDAGDAVGEAAAYRIIVDISAKTQQYEAALKAGQRALAMYRELGDRQADEVSTLIANAGNHIMVTVRKQESGKATEKTLKEGCDKALKAAKEALSTAKKLSDPQLIGGAMHSVAQCHTMAGKATEAMKVAQDGLDIFRQNGDMQGEAAMFVLIANITLLLFNDFQRARDAAEEGIWLFQQVGDKAGEDQGWDMLDRIEKEQAEERRKAQLAQQQQQISAAMTQIPVAFVQHAPEMPPEEEDRRKPGAIPSLAKLDIGAGLSPEVIQKQISDIAKALIGDDEDIDLDTPLMEAGLTSNTAVSLRNGLSEQLPGVNLPVTLTFDYPSIGAMTELVLENASKAALKNR